MPETVSHVAGLILARGGSQGIPLKNLAPLASHPLLVWSLGAMKAFGGFDSLWVSTDHSAIAACASSMGVSVFPRSAKFAQCGTPSVDAVQEFLAHHPEVDIVGLVQCTSPFIRPEYLATAYNLIIEEGFDSVFSVTRDKKLRWSEDAFKYINGEDQISNNITKSINSCHLPCQSECHDVERPTGYALKENTSKNSIIKTENMGHILSNRDNDFESCSTKGYLSANGMSENAKNVNKNSCPCLLSGNVHHSSNNGERSDKRMEGNGQAMVVQLEVNALSGCGGEVVINGHDDVAMDLQHATR